MGPLKDITRYGTVQEMQVSDLHSLVGDLEREGFTGLVSVEGIGLLMFVEGSYIHVMLYGGPMPDTLRVWVRPLSRAEVNLIFSKGTVSSNYIVYHNGGTETIPLPSLGVEEQELGIAFLRSRSDNLMKVITKWLQEMYPHSRVVERELEEASIVVFGSEYLDRVVNLPPDILRILVLERGEEANREAMEEMGILVFDYPYTRSKFLRLLEGWDNPN